jgi:hypothetical protein
MAKKSVASSSDTLPDEPVGSPPSGHTSTPTDGEAPPAGKRKVPKRGIKKRVLGEGEGDYCIFELIGDHEVIPRGSLVPIPTIPRFIDTANAMKWIRTESGDLLAGKQVMIFRACEILSLVVQSKPQVVINTKPKVTVTKPETSDG